MDIFSRVHGRTVFVKSLGPRGVASPGGAAAGAAGDRASRLQMLGLEAPRGQHRGRDTHLRRVRLVRGEGRGVST